MSAPSRNSSISSSDSGNNNSSRPSQAVNSADNNTSPASSNQQPQLPGALRATAPFRVYQTPPRHFNFTNQSLPPTQHIPGTDRVNYDIAYALRDAEAAVRRSGIVNNMMREVSMTPNDIEPPTVQSAETSTLRRQSLSGGVWWATGEVQEYGADFDRAMQAAANARGTQDPAVTLSARDQIDDTMRRHEAAMALIQMATGVQVAQPHQNLAPVAESDEAGSEETVSEEVGSEEVGSEEVGSEEVSDSDEAASVPDATYANPIDNSGTIVTLHRPADQYLWTAADLATLRRDREEAENVRDMQSALNGVNMSGNDDIPPEMHDWAPEDHEVVAARQAETWRAEQEDTQMSYEDSLCDTCGRPDPNVWHPSMGCGPTSPLPMSESDYSDDSMMCLSAPQTRIPGDMLIEIEEAEDHDHDMDDTEDESVHDVYAEMEAEDEFHTAFDAQGADGIETLDYTAVFHAALYRATQDAMANPQHIDRIMEDLVTEWENLGRQLEEDSAQEFTQNILLTIEERMRTHPAFVTLGGQLLAVLRDVATQSGMDPVGGEWALGWGFEE
ncbi:hypothetical protein LTR35_014717 [Friedmanniomyces endolithicus]|uniref:Uncharacterized protein n=1 Tax=Friedmanniomyces endolithicus TaxID=329885 RepID=A0AAN6J3T7_9PEZI|nr:hypothetical protein LTR35_014717 [Friedmanniomyces endolithicus]KAK0271869.1 hypothetical protein LTS00_016483 [Friedmanniomyces endolithicus]KAK0312329.1 hypothetical protein LTR82_013961 [Friedmanniomyces endolithicus]